jgi:hypothetical protein
MHVYYIIYGVLLANPPLCSGTGKKGGKGSTTRRKGRRTAKRTPASAIVDRPA